MAWVLARNSRNFVVQNEKAYIALNRLLVEMDVKGAARE